MVEILPSQVEEAVTEKERGERSESERDTEGGGEARASTECQSRPKKGLVANIYLTDSDENAIVDFVKDHEEINNKTNEHLNDKFRKDCLWERYASS